MRQSRIAPKLCCGTRDRQNSLTTVKEFTLFLQILNLSQEPTHRSWNLFLLQRQFICSQMSGSICFFRNRFFVILQLLGNFLRDFVGRVCFLISHYPHKSIFLLEPDLPIDSPYAAPIFEIRVLNWFHRGQYQNFSVPNFLCAFLPRPQIIFSEPAHSP